MKGACIFMHKHENLHRGTFRCAELKSARSRSQFVTGPPYWMRIQNGRHKNQLFRVTGQKSVCTFMHTHENVHRDTFRSADLKSTKSQSEFSTGLPYWMIQNGRYKKQPFMVTGQRKCVNIYAQA